MNILKNVKVSVEETLSESDQCFTVSKGEVLCLKIAYNESMARAEVERAGSRYQVAVTKVVDFHLGVNYIVSVPDAHFSCEVADVSRVRYKMREKQGTANIDAETVQIAAIKLKMLMDGVTGVGNTDANSTNTEVDSTEQDNELPEGTVKVTFAELCENKDWKEAVIVFTKDTFLVKNFSVKERSYLIDRSEKYFNPLMNGTSLYGSCLDGRDSNVRLDLYMHEIGGDDVWEVEYCYIIK